MSSLLDAKPWWIAGAAYRLLATQADLVPDEALSKIVSHVLADLNAVQEGTLIDLPFFDGSRYLGAIAVLAGISERLSRAQAEQVLTFFEALPPVNESQYRHQDDDESLAIAGILNTHEDISGNSLNHLINLLSRSPGSRKQKALETITNRMPESRPQLEKLADANDTWAREILEVENPATVRPEKVQEARARLEAPLKHKPGVFAVGSASKSVSDSILVRTLPATDQQAALTQLLERAADPLVAARDRASYLLAASNLNPPTDSEQRRAVFNSSLSLAVSPPKSEADSIEEDHRHPLGAFRMLGFRDSRGEAAFLAAGVAETQEEKERVRSAALSLIGDETVSEIWTTETLQRLGETVSPDVGFLSGQNWALRSLSAILWSKTTEPDPVGHKLAVDSDVRVRTTFARQLVKCQAAETIVSVLTPPNDTLSAERRREARESLLEILRNDRSYSVRRATAPLNESETSLPSKMPRME